MLEENIRKMRRERGLTQEQLAEVMGVSTASVSKWETGIAAPELTMLAALADYFEMSIDALMGHTVDKAQLGEKVSAVKALSLAGEDEKAMEQAEELLRRYPNEYCVVEQAASTYYTAYIHTAEKEKMYRCISLTQRKYELSKDNSGRKWFELRAELANCHELLQEWEKAKEYYEESNVSGVNDSAIARCLARMEEDEPAICEMSKVIEQEMFWLVSNLMELAAIWSKQEETRKAKEAYYFALYLLEGSKNQMDFGVLHVSCCLAIALLEQEDGNLERAKEHIRKAIRVETGKELAEDGVERFLNSDKTLQLIHTDFNGNSQIVHYLTAMGEEELLLAAKEELEK